MTKRTLLACGAALLLVACGREGSQAPTPATPPAAAPAAIGGQYEVTGVTIDKKTRLQRQISGRIVVDPEGDRYNAHFELTTLFPGSEAAAAKVIGTGSGTIEGRSLVGTSDTQLMLSNVPGVDVGFAMVPRDVGARIASKSKAEFFDDGSVHIEIENDPAEGQEYSPTHTILVGYPIRKR